MPLRQVAHVRPLYGDTDRMGFVYYANYLRFFETGRCEWLRAAGMSYAAFEETHGMTLPVVEAHVDYRKAARYDDDLAIHAAIGELGAASLRFDYRITREAETIAEGFTRHACMTRAGKVVRLPDAFRKILAD